MKDIVKRVRKLALAYQTGWEYLPGDSEAGSVITDLFTEMMEVNQERWKRIWDKQEREFLQAVPICEEYGGRLKSALCIKAPEGADGELLSEGSRVYAAPEDGDLLWFTVSGALRLTAASLKYALCRTGLSVRLAWDGEGMIPLFASSGRVLEQPVFRWRFSNLCNGLESCAFWTEPEWSPVGDWSITDEKHLYPLEWEETPEGWAVHGITPEYAKNLQDTEYEIVLKLSCQETQEGFETFDRDLSLKEPALSLKPDICLTEDGAGDGSRILPFGFFPDAASCCYLACDEILARAQGEIRLEFTESFDMEEELPAEKQETQGKLYKKYPWLRQETDPRDWKAQETVWEFFDGELWRALPEGGRETGCWKEEDQGGERSIRWKRPRDMGACCVDGHEHFYIRLRAVKVAGAYARYYRKYVPVLENIRFAKQECIWEQEGREGPDMSEAGQKKMYLGFDHAVTPDNRWYMEYQGEKGQGRGELFFAEGQTAGWGRRFGMDAFWVELTPEELRKALPADAESMRLTANYARILQTLSLSESDSGGERIKPAQGTAFYVETEKAGVLDAASVMDAYYDGAGAPCRTGIREAENFFARFGRLVTPMDIKTLFQDRYPSMQVISCDFEESTRELVVKTTAGDGFAGDRTDDVRLWEIKGWLEEEIRRTGSIWLENCQVRIEFVCQEERDA